MVPPEVRNVIYNNYSNGLRQLKQYPNAVETYHEAISIPRILVNNTPAMHNLYFAHILMNMGNALIDRGKYYDASVANKEALEICTTMSA